MLNHKITFPDIPLTNSLPPPTIPHLMYQPLSIPDRTNRSYHFSSSSFPNIRQSKEDENPDWKKDVD